MKNGYFDTFFKENILDKKQRVTIILGSGFHKSVFQKRPNYNNCLTSWCCLLKEINPNAELSNNYLLDFEKIVLDNSKVQDEEAAYKIEAKLLKEGALVIKKMQDKTIKDSKINYPLEIFNSEFVSDVISLNFDLIPELLLNNNKKTRAQYLYNGTSKKTKLPSTRHRVVKGITFWHPHGDIDKPDSLILGTRKYGLHINNIEKLRKRSKKQDKPHDYKKSWYEVLTHNTVIILGADVSDMEWDIWSAIVNRERNYGKKENQIKFKFPIFQMRESKNLGNKNKSNEIWFYPLFDEKISFNEQWAMLSKILSK
jgi:hypothetical protein